LRERSIVLPGRWRNVRRKTAVFLPFDPPAGPLRKALAARGAKEIAAPYARVFLTPDRVVVYGAVGAPLTAICMEELMASGVRDFLMLGIGGSLRDDYPIGAIVCATKALAEEGTSRAYFAKKRTFLPAPDLKRGLQARLTRSGLAYEPGVVVTTDAVYRETPSWLERNRRRGACLVDMETSAVLAVAEHHHRRAAALLVVSDELFTGSWRNGIDDPRFAGNIVAAFLPFLG
jgi:uridine phosphorylase